jgi:hypothetical protein
MLCDRLTGFISTAPLPAFPSLRYMHGGGVINKTRKTIVSDMQGIEKGLSVGNGAGWREVHSLGRGQSPASSNSS